MVRLVIDTRERQLIKLFGEGEVEVQSLDVGDVLCEYESGNSWLAERKTADDLARSVIDGRWDEQKDRLRKSGRKVVYVIEGDLRKTKFSYEALVGACVNATMDDAFLYRTTDILETKHLLLQLAKKFEGKVDAPKTLGVTNKRKKDSEIETIWIRQLMCIPMISEGVARAIMKHFGNNINELREALKAPLILC